MRAAGDGEPPAGGEDDAVAFGGGDAFRRAAVAGVAAQADFDENEGVAVETDEVDFAGAAAHVAGEDFQTLRGEPFRGARFAQTSARLRQGRGRFHNRACCALPFFAGVFIHERIRLAARQYAVIVRGGDPARKHGRFDAARPRHAGGGRRRRRRGHAA